ncbi:signal transduction histidine kinase, LytS [Cellulophaga algicola DSM 14237]|uniref:Signal transduction histidine kinase, LytS n=1 Tax=Cellulophaga algicola (strain DSM 14237 / IC166 / ACAM 630) TaxID=688270 RepID=E6XEL4_CELAD|nr:histidine kinase [Cellulophaga algicola]ADV51342.1 signal transduction histidine kinase, LytS [Cellulophaga algicola DSM 14237]
MKATKRFIFQSLLWIIIWLVLWITQSFDFGFFRENLLSLLFQILLIAGLIFFAAPKLLFKKKYLVFLIIGLSAIVLGSYISSTLFSMPRPPIPSRMPGVENIPTGIPRYTPRGAPSKFLIHFLLLAVSAVLGTFLETLLYAQKKEEETIKNNNERLATELKLLKSQINPHFLFNTLNNIYALSAISATKTQESISYLANMLRYVLYDCEQAFVPLSKEISYIENYIKLFTTKSSKTYPISTTYEIEVKGVLIAPMLIIPFVENAFKHSNIEKVDNTFLTIKVTSKENQIYFEVENSKSITVEIKDEVGGIGLENVKKRLAILYPDKHELIIQDLPESFKVSLKLSLK